MKPRKSRIDLHVHTRGSDGIGSPDAIAREAKKAGLTGLAITDHHLTFTAEGLEVARECRRQGLTVFHGCEYSTDNGHLLIFGVNVEELNLGRYPKMQEVIDKVNNAGGVAIPAHPFKGYKRMLGDDLFTLTGIDVVEGANGQCAVKNERANNKAKNAARSRNWGMTGGSDAHFPECVGTCFTQFEEEIKTEKELLQALRSNKFRAITSKKKVREERGRWARWKSGVESGKSWKSLESNFKIQKLDRKQKQAARAGKPFTREMFYDVIDTPIDPFHFDSGS